MNVSKKILLVEDELFIRELYERVLAQGGYTMVTAGDGEEGLAKADGQFDLILLDIMMPKLNGIDVLKRLKADEKTKKVPVILLTNLGQESIIKQALEVGAAGYFMKMRLTPYELTLKLKEFFINPDQKIDIHNLKLD